MARKHAHTNEILWSFSVEKNHFCCNELRLSYLIDFRTDAECLLVHDGDFLVRESSGSSGQYVLTGMQANNRKHLLLVDPEVCIIRGRVARPPVLTITS